MIKEKIEIILKKILVEIGIKDVIFDLDHPANPSHGDYSTSIALKLTKILKKNPLNIAEQIVSNLSPDKLIKKVEIIKPGFINFWINDEYFIKETQKFAENKIEYPQVHLGKNKKIMVEFAHPNTHKLFHIGHLRNISTGESIVRILEAVGNKVIRSNYQGDVGLHIAKCLWGIKNYELRITNLKTLNEKIELIGKAYTKGSQVYEKDEKAKQEIININRMIYDLDPKILPLWKETREWSLEYYNEIYKRVDSHFDRLYFESELPKRGIKICKDAEKKGILEKSEGALVFNGKKYGLDIRVFINSLGFLTYEGKEMALAEKEFSEFGELDKNIHVVTPEQISFFKVTFKVEELLDEKKFKNKQYHLIYEWVNLKKGKMSSREGNIIEGNRLIDEAKKEIQKLFKCKDSIAETLAVGSIKYSFLKNSVSNPIAFDFKESISLEGNSAPYLIYTYVRCQSVLKKIDNNIFFHDRGKNGYLKQEETNILRLFYQFPEIVEKASQNLSPNYIATYLFNLAQVFNLFYQKCPILTAKTDEKLLRILITKATANIIRQGLYLLGIKTVERM